jgi:hypothetical protein
MEPEFCSECCGTGQVAIPCECCTGKYSFIGHVFCYGCTGTGNQLFKCPACDGTGIISVEHSNEGIGVKNIKYPISKLLAHSNSR